MTKKTKVRIFILCGIVLSILSIRPSAKANSEIASLAIDTNFNEQVKFYELFKNTVAEEESCAIRFFKAHAKAKVLETENEKDYIIYSAVSKLNARSKPSTSGQVVTTFQYGETIVYSDCVNGWFKVSYEGMFIYVCGEYVTYDKPEHNKYELDINDLYIDYAIEIAEKYDNLDAALLIAVMETESRGLPNVVSSCNAVGLMQLIPKWFTSRMEKLELEDIYDPYTNIYLGADYLSELIDKYGNVRTALMCYNEGEYRGAPYRGSKGKYSSYAKTIYARAKELREEI